MTVKFDGAESFTNCTLPGIVMRWSQREPMDAHVSTNAPTKCKMVPVGIRLQTLLHQWLTILTPGGGVPGLLTSERRGYVSELVGERAAKRMRCSLALD